MKHLFFCCIVSVLMLPANAQVTVTTSTQLYQSASLSSKGIKIMYEGEKVGLIEKTNDFWKVTAGKSIGYIHQSCLSNYVNPIQSNNPTKAITAIQPTNRATEVKPQQHQQPQNTQGYSPYYSLKTPGDALIKAGNLALGGAALSFAGSLVMVSTALFSDNLVVIATGSLIGYGCAVVAGIMQLVAWDKLKQAGIKLNQLGIGYPSQGIGVAFKLH